MKNSKRILALILCVVLACSVLSGCNQNSSETLSDEATYKVTVVDGLGTPYTEKVIVKFMQNGTQVAMGPINAQGVAEKTLKRGDYTVEIASTNSGLICYALPATLTAEVTEVSVVMSYAPTEFSPISVLSGEKDPDTGEELPYQAGKVNEGSAYIKLDSEKRSYVTFAPSKAGVYKFSVTGDDATVGYYGSPYFVQNNNVAENVDGNTFTISVGADMIGEGLTGTTVFVIGLDAAEGKEGCILNINRVGDPAWTIESEPWQNYQAKAPITNFVLPDGVVLKDFDITAPTDTYKLVLNESEGVYHLGTADGPKVYVRLGTPVYGICMKDMVGEIVYDADGVLLQTGTAPFRYSYNNGKDDFFKEDYTDVMRQIVTAVDKGTGVYPLTQDLFYMLPLGIKNMGWCIEDTINYLFNNVAGLNKDIAWMFMLCHEEGTIPGGNTTPDDKPNPDDKPPTPDGPIEDNKTDPIVIGSTLNFTADVKANHIVYFDLMRVNDTTLTIKSKDAYVIYNGRKYEAKNGVVTVPNLYSDHINTPVSIQIGNKGSKDASFAVSLTYPEGHRENPYKMVVGALTTKQKAGDSDGVFYEFTASAAGKLTITISSATKGTNAGISITKLKDGVPMVYSLEAGADSISVELEKGESVEIIICATTDILGTYPMSTIKSTVTFG